MLNAVVDEHVFGKYYRLDAMFACVLDAGIANYGEADWVATKRSIAGSFGMQLEACPVDTVSADAPGTPAHSPSEPAASTAPSMPAATEVATSVGVCSISHGHFDGGGNSHGEEPRREIDESGSGAAGIGVEGSDVVIDAIAADDDDAVGREVVPHEGGSGPADASGRAVDKLRAEVARWKYRAAKKDRALRAAKKREVRVRKAHRKQLTKVTTELQELKKQFILKRGRRLRFFSNRGGLQLALRTSMSNSATVSVGLIAGLDVSGTAARTWQLKLRAARLASFRRWLADNYGELGSGCYGRGLKFVVHALRADATPAAVWLHKLHVLEVSLILRLIVGN